MVVNQDVINLRRTYKTKAHAEAMQSMGICLNNARSVFEVQKAVPSGVPVDVEAERRYWQEKALTQTQQDVVGGILKMIEELQSTAEQINIQAAAFGLRLPKLELYEVAGYYGDVYRLVKDAETAAAKTGSAVLLDRLMKVKEFRDLAAHVAARR